MTRPGARRRALLRKSRTIRSGGCRFGSPYDAWLDSKVANINNAPSGGFAGSITCALFLQRFVEAAKSWLHVDIYGWTPSAKPARPEGGECQAARAIYSIAERALCVIRDEIQG
jgi:leucyl aminopeptidase